MIKLLSVFVLALFFSAYQLYPIGRHTAAPAVIRPPQATTISVLMYHRVGVNFPANDNSITLDRFVDQLDLLNHQGYTTVTIQQVADFMNKKISLPEKSVAITFDDGWADDIIAAKELAARNMAATFFIITGAIDDAPAYLTSNQIVELSKNPRFEIGAHSHTHFVSHAQNLPGEVTTGMLIDEAKQSKVVLEKLIQLPVTSLAWPYGYSTDDAIAASTILGFTSTSLVTGTSVLQVVNNGSNLPGDSPLRIKRLSVDGRCNLEVFINMITTQQSVGCAKSNVETTYETSN